MIRRLGSIVLMTSLVATSAPCAAWAQDPAAPPPAAPAPPPAQPPASPPPATPPPAAPAAQAAPAGAIVVATWDAAGPAARALAFDVYREADLRPTIDDATARVLAGEAAPDTASARLKEIAELRASIVRSYAAMNTPPPAAGAPAPGAPAPGAPAPGAPAPGAPPAAPPAPPSDLVARRLLASLGSDLGAVLVIAVGMDGSRPLARVLRTSTAAFERVELGPTVDIGADGARTFRWPGAAGSIHALLAPPTPPPLAPKAEGGVTVNTFIPSLGDKPFYKSGWFWGSVGGAVAIGLGVFLISRATSSPGNVHLTGKVDP